MSLYRKQKITIKKGFNIKDLKTQIKNKFNNKINKNNKNNENYKPKYSKLNISEPVSESSYIVKMKYKIEKIPLKVTKIIYQNLFLV